MTYLIRSIFLLFFCCLSNSEKITKFKFSTLNTTLPHADKTNH